MKVSSQEYLAAIAGLNHWLDSGKVEKFKNGTINPPPPPSTARFENGGAYGAIINVDPAYGHITTDFVEVDFDRLGIKLSDSFEVRIKGKSYQATLALNYSGIERGQWFTFIDADGYTFMGINYMSLDTAVGIEASETVPVFIRKRQSP